MSFSSNLNRIMASLDVDQSELSRRLNVSPQAVNQWCKGITRPGNERAQSLAKALGITLDELFSENANDPPIKKPVASDDLTMIIPELDINPQAGFGAEMPPLNGNGEHIVIAEWVLPRGFFGKSIQDTNHLRLLEVRGDSMQPDYMAGDKVLVDISQKGPTPPGVYVLWDGFGLVLKQIELMVGRRPPTILISSINKNYATYECLLEDISIGGRIIGRWDWK